MICLKEISWNLNQNISVRFINIKSKPFYFMMKIMRMSYLSSVKSNEIICLTNLMSDIFKITDSVNVIKISNSEENKCISNESQTLR